MINLKTYLITNFFLIYPIIITFKVKSHFIFLSVIVSHIQFILNLRLINLQVIIFAFIKNIYNYIKI
jgi:hypothetical protein